MGGAECHPQSPRREYILIQARLGDDIAGHFTCVKRNRSHGFSEAARDVEIYLVIDGTENTGFEIKDNVNPRNEIARYLVWPGQSTSYYVGFLKIMDLRNKASDELGDQFDIKEFHRAILLNGSLPLEILEQVIDNYIFDQLSTN